MEFRFCIPIIQLPDAVRAVGTVNRMQSWYLTGSRDTQKQQANYNSDSYIFVSNPVYYLQWNPCMRW